MKAKQPGGFINNNNPILPLHLKLNSRITKMQTTADKLKAGDRATRPTVAQIDSHGGGPTAKA